MIPATSGQYKRNLARLAYQQASRHALLDIELLEQDREDTERYLDSLAASLPRTWEE